MDTKKLFMLLIILIGLVFFVSQEVIAECPEGKVDITISNPGGKVIELCVPEQVVDKIGGPQDIVVPAVCPCWSPNELDYYTDKFIENSGYGDYLCGNLTCNAAPLIFSTVTNEFRAGMNSEHTYCVILCEDFLPTQYYRQEYFATPEEYEACRVSLLNSYLWNQCCEQ